MHNEWILERLNVIESWEEVDSSLKDIKVAFLDTGCNINMKYLKNINLEGIDFNGRKNIEDKLGHGTFFAGIIKQFIPINKCGSPKIISINVVDKGKIHIKNIIKGINLAIDLGVDVLNIGACNGYYNKEIASTLYKAYKSNIILISPCGNRIRGFSSYPASLSTVISCGSSNIDNSIANHSNCNKSLDILAPGEELYSCFNQEEEFRFLSGTSFAAAIVTALATLAKSKFKNINVDIFRDALNNSPTNICYEIKHSSTEYHRKLVDFSSTLKYLKTNIFLDKQHISNDLHLNINFENNSLLQKRWIAIVYDRQGIRKEINIKGINIELIKQGELCDTLEKEVLNGKLEWSFDTENLDDCFVKISCKNKEFDSILIMMKN